MQCVHMPCWLAPILQPSSWYAGHSDNDTDFITTLTGLFKDIATAVEENHDMLLGSFGGPFLVNFILGLQAECDIQVRHCTSAVLHILLACLPNCCHNALGKLMGHCMHLLFCKIVATQLLAPLKKD